MSEDDDLSVYVNAKEENIKEIADWEFVDTRVTNIFDVAEMGKMLGQGSFGEVYKAVLKRNVGRAVAGQTVAIKAQYFEKEYENDEERQQRLEMLRTEIVALQAAGDACSSVYKLYDVIYDPDKMILYFILEFVEGVELFDYLEASEKFTSVHKVNDPSFLPAKFEEPMPISEQDLFDEYIYPLMSGLNCIHSEGIAHRDIKTENVMVANTGELVWVDFGLSCIRTCDEDDIVGTPTTIAPQVLALTLKDGGVNSIEWQKADVWSFGCMIYEMMTGGDYPVQMKIVEASENNAINLGRFINELGGPSVYFDLYPEVSYLLSVCFQVNPDVRWDAWLQFNSNEQRQARDERLIDAPKTIPALKPELAELIEDSFSGSATDEEDMNNRFEGMALDADNISSPLRATQNLPVDISKGQFKLPVY